jgi:hypothetical protein
MPMLVHAQALSNQWSATYTQLGASACVGGA